MDFHSNDSRPLWGKRGTAKYVSSSIKDATCGPLEISLKEAQRIKTEARMGAARKKIIKNISKRSIVIVEKLEESYLDETEIKGLIGEMILEEMVEFHCHTLIYAKWRTSGSSKSNGLDLISYRATGHGRRLVVNESKHLHDEIRKSSSRHIAIRDKCVEAIEQSDPNHILCSLSDTIAKFGSQIAFSEATGHVTSDLEEKYGLMEKAFSDSDYELWVSVFVDDQYCARTEYGNCISNLSEPLPEYGESLTVEIVAIKALEGTTLDLCGKFVK